MDFGSILHVAQKNEKLPKKEIKYYSTKFDPPKKEERSKQLSSNIKKFLARKEAEEKKKSVEANSKREELLALRSQDKKATRRVSVMLKRTKSANKSVIQDAVDNDNTAVTLAGPSQPDEDDYGYVSQEASAYYNKMMQKYNNMPEDSKFAKSKRSVSVNLNGTKDRVRAALLREQEEALLPHKRKRRPKDDDISNDTYNNDDDYRSEQSQERSSTKSKPKAAAPPPINFSELLKLAEKKQFEPIKMEPKKEVKEEERPMTKRQKRELEKEKAWRERKEKGITNGGEKESVPGASRPGDKSMGPPNKIPKLNNGAPSNGKIPKLPGAEERSKNGQRPAQQSSQSIPRRADDRPGNVRRDDRDRIRDERDRLRDEMDRMRMERDRLRDERDKIRDDRDRLKNDDRNTVRKSDTDRGRVTSNGTNHSSSTDRRPDPSKASKLRQELEKDRSLGKTSSSRPPGAQLNKPTAAKATSALDKSKGLTRRDISVKDMKSRPLMQGQDRPKQFPPADLKPKQFPPADLKPKQFPPPDVRRKQFPPKDVKRRPPMGHKRRILDDDSEYDSEMDDFIDDGPGEGEDYSKYISEIFGYDKSRYRHVDEMDDNMESSFSQVMKEEFISGKIGLMEDLEDMKQEAEDKKRKQERMKKIKK